MPFDPRQLEQPVRPVPAGDVPEQGARRVGRVDYRGADPARAVRSGACIGEAGRKETRQRPHAQVSLAACCGDRRQVVQAPAELAGSVVRRGDQAGDGPDLVRIQSEAREPVRVAPVLPGNGGGQWLAGPGMPAYESRALGRHPRANDPQASIHLRTGRAYRFAHRGEEGFRIVFGPARGRVAGGHRDLGLGSQPSIAGVDERLTRMTALVEDEPCRGGLYR